jgi:hypothetical protein
LGECHVDDRDSLFDGEGLEDLLRFLVGHRTRKQVNVLTILYDYRGLCGDRRAQGGFLLKVGAVMPVRVKLLAPGFVETFEVGFDRLGARRPREDTSL